MTENAQLFRVDGVGFDELSRLSCCQNVGVQRVSLRVTLNVFGGPLNGKRDSNAEAL